jgi:hypothetical protein
MLVLVSTETLMAACGEQFPGIHVTALCQGKCTHMGHARDEQARQQYDARQSEALHVADAD